MQPCNAGVANSNMRLSARNKPAEHPAEPPSLSIASLSHRLHMPVTDANTGSADCTMNHHRLMTTNQINLTSAPVLGLVLQQPSGQTHLAQRGQPKHKPAEAMHSQLGVQRHCNAAAHLATRPATSASYADVTRQQGASQGPRLTHRAEVRAEAVPSAATAVSSRCDHSQLDSWTQHAEGNRTAALTTAVPLEQLQSAEVAATSTAAVAAEDSSQRPGLQNSQAMAPAVAPRVDMQGLPGRGTLHSTGTATSGMQGNSCQPEAAHSDRSFVRHNEAESPWDSKENQPQAVTMARAVPGKGHNPAAALGAVKPSRPVSSSKVCPKPFI